MKNLNPENTVRLAQQLEQPARDTGLLVLRVMLGGLFVFHGGAKFMNGIDGFAGYLDSLGVPFPMLNAYMAAGTEVLAGLAVIVGLFTRLAAIPLAFTMAVAFVTAKGATLSAQGGGGEYPLALGLAAVALALTGPGRFNVTTPLLRAVRAHAPARQASINAPAIATA